MTKNRMDQRTKIEQDLNNLRFRANQYYEKWYESTLRQESGYDGDHAQDKGKDTPSAVLNC